MYAIQNVERRNPKPRWGLLYVIVTALCGLLAVVEVAVPDGLARRTLEFAVVPAMLVGMALWVRANRLAIALANEQHPARSRPPLAEAARHDGDGARTYAARSTYAAVSQYTPGGTPIEISATANDGGVALEVADRGPGLAPGDEQRVFEKFYRSPTVPARGSGLGLSICRGIGEAHGGRIEATNRPGGGAVFRITLPAAEPAPTVEHVE
jgi:hypothetical protein